MKHINGFNRLVFTAYLQKSALLVWFRGDAFAHFFKPHRGAFPAFTIKKKKTDKCPGGWVRLELTEPLRPRQFEVCFDLGASSVVRHTTILFAHFRHAYDS